MKNFSLINIIEARIKFINENEIYDREEYKYGNIGELSAYNEMLADIKSYTKDEFVCKYLKIINEMKTSIENEIYSDENECERVSGYNNAIIFVLSLIDPIYEYDLDNE